MLTFVAATGSALLGFLYVFVFSLGLTALLVAVGLPRVAYTGVGGDQSFLQALRRVALP